MLRIKAIPFACPTPVAVEITIPFAINNPSMSSTVMMVRTIKIYRSAIAKHR